MRKRLRIFLIISIIIAAILVVKAVLFFTAKPKVTVNYVAEYNRISHPENYDPNENAAPYYQKAFDAFVEMPEELQSLYNNWPTDYIDFEQAMLESWVASNSQAFAYFKEAVNKPCYWLERHAKEDEMFNMMILEATPLNHLTKALLWNAKLAASKGRPQTAFENIIDCYRVGCQKCRTPSSLTEQHVGMDFRKTAAYNALLILDKTQVDSSALKLFQDALQAEFDSDTYVPDFTAEKLFLYDALQRTFIDNGRGTGRLAWSVTKGFAVIHYGWTNIKMQLNCFIGPTRKQIAEQIEKACAISNQIMAKTPWQIKSEELDYFEEIEKIKNSNFFVQILILSPKGTFDLYHKTKAQTKALIAVLAILHFKADNHRLPATLDELVSAGYLQSIPMDPYSNGPLVYKPDEDNFKLYSVGEDFSDDGGTIIAPHTQSPDIVYWPYKDLMKLYNAHIIEMGKIKKKTERNLLILYSENAELNEIRQLKEEWWKDIESEFAKYPKEYPDINKIRCYKEDWWGVIEKDAKNSLEKADHNQPK